MRTERYSWVSIVNRLRTGQLWNVSSISDRCIDILLLQNVPVSMKYDGPNVFSSVENRVGDVQFTVKFHLVHRSGMSGFMVPPIHQIKQWVQ